MKELIPVPKMSEVLRTEFMEPLGLSAYRVADTDLRLCKYFGMSKGFFLRLQMDLDLLEAEDTEGLQADLKNIRCITNSCTAD